MAGRHLSFPLKSCALVEHERNFFRSLFGAVLINLVGAVLSSTGPFGCVTGALAADDLKLRSGISYTQDIDSGFPIMGSNMDDCKIAVSTPTFIFFGASGDLNTNRQAKRVVYLAKKYAAHSVKFIVIDVDHPPNEDAKSLIKTYYHGYIPCEVLLDKAAKLFWSHDGEVEFAVLKSQIDKSLD